MPAWPGGPCPQCGEDMPENVIHCRTCRTLLNSDLQPDTIEIPPFIPLQEIEAMVDAEPLGYYVGCPSCDQELRISRKYLGQRVQCKFCSAPFMFDLRLPRLSVPAFYVNCPHCREELRVASKYAGAKVACKHCAGKIQLVERAAVR